MKRSSQYKEINCTQPSPSVRVPRLVTFRGKLPRQIATLHVMTLGTYTEWHYEVRNEECQGMVAVLRPALTFTVIIYTAACTTKLK